MIDWQPIETAPKDGTKLLCYENGEMFVTRWESTRNGFGEHITGWIEPDIGELGPYTCEPTHWKPLPEPPK